MDGHTYIRTYILTFYLTQMLRNYIVIIIMATIQKGYSYVGPLKHTYMHLSSHEDNK